MLVGDSSAWIDALQRASRRNEPPEWEWYEPAVAAIRRLPNGDQMLAEAVRNDDVLLAFAHATCGALWCIRAIGIEEAGRRYARQLIRRLDDRQAGHAPTWNWLDDEGWNGENLPEDFYYDFIVFACDEAKDHEGALWCIGDGPRDHMGLAWRPRFQADRATHPGIDKMYVVMEAWEAEIGWNRDDGPR